MNNCGQYGYSKGHGRHRNFYGSPQMWKWASRRRVWYDYDEETNSYKIEFEFPGRSKDEISIRASSNILQVELKAKSEDEKPKKRSLEFDKTIDFENIKASYNNGLLTVNVPLAESNDLVDINIG